MIHDSFDESVEMYLKTVFELKDGETDLVAISRLAKRLAVTTVSATEMVHRLSERALMNHTPYKGVALTEEGRMRALRVIRRHRLWECFLADHLNLPWATVHDAACQLEHATPPEVTDALAEFLEEPATCPHGSPIPSASGELSSPKDSSLSELGPGDSGIVTRIHPENGQILNYLAARNIKPGASIRFDGFAPLNGPLELTVAERAQTLGQEIARRIYVDAT